MQYIRIHPHNPQKGFKVKRFGYRGMRFSVEKGWYQVTDEFAEEVKDFTQNLNDPDSKPLFQVASEEEARKLSMKDYEEKNPEVQIEQAVAGAQVVEEEKLQEPTPTAKKKRDRFSKKSSKKDSELKNAMPEKTSSILD